jgi:PAS domain S-box-containing protein
MEKMDRDLSIDGTYKWLDWTDFPVEDTIYAIARDITGRNRRAKTWQDSDDFYRTLLETASVGIVIVNGAGEIMMANTEIEQLFGYGRHELIGFPVETLLPKRFHVRHRRHRERHNANPQVRPMGKNIELVARHKDGSEFPVEVALSYVTKEGETLSIAHISDISVRKRAEATREQLINELEAFAHTAAHDLKSPLAVIQGYADFLNSQYDTLAEDQKREILTDIEMTSRKMKSIVDELLLLASVRTLDEVSTEPLNMSLIVEEAKARLAPMIKEHDAVITLPETWPLACGYAPWVEEILVNYMSNAMKYGGTPPHLELGADTADSRMVCFWIRDNGRGLNREEQSLLFTPFTRLNKDDINGNGLGLSIIRRIVEKLGGQAGVQSELGLGSTFYFTLPRVEVFERTQQAGEIALSTTLDAQLAR